MPQVLFAPAVNKWRTLAQGTASGTQMQFSMPSQYSRFRLGLAGLYWNALNPLFWQVSPTNGSPYDGGATDYTQVQEMIVSSGITVATSSNTVGSLVSGNNTTSGDQRYNSTMDVFPGGASDYATAHVDASYKNSAGNQEHYRSVIKRTATGLKLGAVIFAGAGTFSAGTYLWEALLP